MTLLRVVPERVEAMGMQVETNEPAIIERVAALDIGKSSRQ